MINCEISLTLTWSASCALTSKATRDADPDVYPEVVATNKPTDATLAITDTKLYVSVANLSTQDDNKLLQQLNTGLNELLNGIGKDQKCLIRLKMTT